jgi:hypothetical protein
MVDLSTYTDEELLQMGGVKQSPVKQMTNDELFQAAGITPPTFTEKVGGDLAQRGREFGVDLLDPNKPISTAPFRYAGAIGGAAGDVVMRGLGEITPQPIQDALKSGVEYVAQTRPAQAILQRAKAFKESYPNVTDVLSGGATMLGAPVATKVGKESLEAAGKVALDIASPNVPEGLADIALSAQKYDIPVSIPQVSDARSVKNIQKLGQELPFSGYEAFRDKQLGAWQKALFKTVGMDADRFTPKTMDKAFSKVGGEFDSLTKGKRFDVANDFQNAVIETVQDAQELYGKDAADIFQKQALKVIDEFNPDGTISGESLAFQRARLNKLARRTTDEANKTALQDLENILIDNITSQDPVLREALNTAKYHYKNLIAIEPLAQKAKKGFISPTQLNSRVSRIYGRAHTTGKSGEIGELANIGFQLLGELGGSDSVQKGLYAGASLGAGYIDPLSAGAALSLNRAVQGGLYRNQPLVKAGVEKTLRREARKNKDMK